MEPSLHKKRNFVEKRAISLPGGAITLVTVVLNNQHFNTTSPGFVDLGFCIQNTTVNCTMESQFNSITNCSIKDSITITPATVNYNVVLPNVNANGILRVRYVTNVGINYYSCSTVTLTQSVNPISPGCQSFTAFMPVIQTTYSPPVTVSITPINNMGTIASSALTLLGYPILYAGIGIGVIGLVILSLIVIIIVGIVLIRKRSRNSTDNLIATRAQGKSIPTMSLQDIQTTRMQTVNTVY